MEDSYVRDSQLSTHDDHTVENSHAREDPPLKLKNIHQMKNNKSKGNPNQKMKRGMY